MGEPVHRVALAMVVQIDPEERHTAYFARTSPGGKGSASF
jgi:hypothetical protein